MYINMKVTECDFTGQKYDHPVNGAGVIARGATGRWCIVMCAGPEFLSEGNITPISVEQAREKIDNRPGEWCDF